MKLNNKGFSFVELLAAVAILAILSSFAIVGVSSILDKSHKEYYNNERKNLVLAAQAYMNENKSQLPKVVGKKVRVEANKLKEANYLKKDIRTYNDKGSCMDSFVNVFKYGQSDYSYTAYLDCEREDKDAYKDPANVSPTFAVNWPTNNKDVALSYVKITVNGGDEDNPINLLSYSYTISIYNESKEKFEDIINSGIKIYRAPSFTKDVSLAKYTIKGNARMRVKMTATNINGVSKSQVFLRNFKDDVAPNCIIKPEDTINTPAGKKPWVNDKRTITIGCDDGDGSGCEKKSYTKTFTADNIEDYITIKDNAGESKKCYVTTYIDKTKPKIVATAYKCKPGSTTADTNQKVAETTATTDTK